jgi:hypothetical protein
MPRDINNTVPMFEDRGRNHFQVWEIDPPKDLPSLGELFRMAASGELGYQLTVKSIPGSVTVHLQANRSSREHNIGVPTGFDRQALDPYIVGVALTLREHLAAKEARGRDKLNRPAPAAPAPEGGVFENPNPPPALADS